MHRVLPSGSNARTDSVTALPNPGWYFSSWTGDCAGAATYAFSVPAIVSNSDVLLNCGVTFTLETAAGTVDVGSYYIVRPAIFSSLTPGSGPAGTQVTMAGQWLMQATALTAVEQTTGYNLQISASPQSDSQLTFAAPAWQQATTDPTQEWCVFAFTGAGTPGSSSVYFRLEDNDGGTRTCIDLITCYRGCIAQSNATAACQASCDTTVRNHCERAIAAAYFTEALGDCYADAGPCSVYAGHPYDGPGCSYCMGAVAGACDSTGTCDGGVSSAAYTKCARAAHSPP